ncbi:MAG: hypothetical protein JKY50_01560 [Oleispira sp.]|nr:hypothetical protein [Oleispira sp.]MBL4879943.1 hypothetical protein [Oleispira sp.]
MNHIYSVIFIFLLSACGSDSKDSVNDDQGPTLNALNLQPITASEGIFSGRLGEITSFEKIVQLNNDRLLILGETSVLAENGKLDGFFAITNKQGSVYSLDNNSGGYIDACVHPSGEYSLGVLLYTESQSHQVEIQRYSAGGQLLYSAPMLATTLEQKYLIPFSQEEWLTSPFEIVENPNTNIDQRYHQNSVSWGRFGAVTFNCEQEELLVAFNNDGQKLAKYGIDLTFQWEQVVSIYYWDNSDRGAGTAQISHSQDGDIFIVDTLTTNAIPAYNHRFESTIAQVENTRQTTSHILFKHLDSQGNLIEERLISSIHSHFLKDIALYNHQLFVGSIGHITKSDEPNNTRELDISLININTFDYTYSQEWHDLNKEDWLNGLALDGDSLYLFGHTGGSQVDSNSWVSDTEAFYAKYDIEQQSLTAATTIKTGRSSEIKDLIVSEGKVTAVGVSNAPLTHTSDISRQALFISQ